MKKYDYDYWKKMTWNWYAVPDLRTVRYNKSSKSKGVFRLCDVCDYVFSYRKSILHQYTSIPKIHLHKATCPKCLGEDVRLERC